MHKSIAGIALGLILFPIAAGAGEITFDVDMGGPQATIDSNGLTLSSGTNANEFSTDGTLAGDSDNAVPTEKAVKTYVDNSTGTLIVNMPDFSSPSETTAPSVSAIKDFVDTKSPSRNFVICGDFTEDICWPKGDTPVSGANVGYGPALIRLINSGPTHNLSRSTDVPTFASSGHTSKSSFLAKVASGSASPAHSLVEYIVTGYDYKQLHRKTVTLSFYAKFVDASASGTKDFCVTLRNSVGSRLLTKEYQLTANGGWEKESITIDLDDVDAKWNFNHEQGMRISWVLAANDDKDNLTEGVWTDVVSDPSGELATESCGDNNSVENTNAEFYLSQVKLEVGESSSPWTPYLWNENVPNLEWYVERIGRSAISFYAMGMAKTPVSGNPAGHYILPISRKRDVPDLFYSSLSDLKHICASQTTPIAFGSFADGGYTNSSVRVYDLNNASLNAGDPCYLQIGADGYIIIDSRH